MSYRQSMGAGFGGSQNRTPAPSTVKKKKQEEDFTLLLVRKALSGFLHIFDSPFYLETL